MCKNMPPLELAIQFHGHICPGLLMGVRAAEFALQHLDISADSDEEVLAVVETDSCGVDAIQSILGCTFGKGNLIFKDYGKNVYTIASRDKNQAVRVVQRYGVKFGPEGERFRQLAGKNPLSEDEKCEKENLLGVMFERIMSMPFDDLFKWQDVDFDFPEKARIYQTLQCEGCGEGVSEPHAQMTDKGILCPDCRIKEED